LRLAELKWRAKDVGAIAEFLTSAACDEDVRFAILERKTCLIRSLTGCPSCKMRCGRTLAEIERREVARAARTSQRATLPHRSQLVASCNRDALSLAALHGRSYKFIESMFCGAGSTLRCSDNA
jgi:hypothetical protein